MGTEIDGVNGIIKNTTSDGDITIKGNDGGSEISALVFDMSAAGAATFNNKIIATELDISGAIDVDGTTNLDVVDIDGAVDMASTLQVSGLITASANITMAGTTPTLTIGDGGEEDAKIIFDGNAQNFSMGLDDSTDLLTIGLGNTLGQYPAITIDENTNVVIPDSSLTVIGTGNYDIITLKSTDADSNVGPVLNFTRDSSSPANDDFLGELTFQGDNNAGETHDYIRMFARILNVADGSEQADFIMKDATGNNIVNFAHSEVVYNDDSVDRDFRVESNDNSDMLNINAGTNRVGIAGPADLGVGLHIRTADSGGNVNVAADELVIENSGSAGITILTGNSTSGSIHFGDDGDNDKGFISYSHNTDDMFFSVNGNGSAYSLVLFDGGQVSTGGETAPDTGDGGLCLEQGANDGLILSMKSSDIAHGVTGVTETDTYGQLQKFNVSEGGLGITGLSESASPGLNLAGIVTNGSNTEATGSEGAVHIDSFSKSGTGTADLGDDDNILCVRDQSNTRFIVKGDGELFSDQSATVGTYDAYEDAQLIRAFDLNHMQGVINSKFDKFVQYNKDDLQKAKLIGTDKDGNATPFVNITGMSRLHNGAIWQQYEKTERLANAVYELAKAAVGEDKANEILEQNEIKLLN